MQSKALFLAKLSSLFESTPMIRQILIFIALPKASLCLHFELWCFILNYHDAFYIKSDLN